MVLSLVVDTDNLINLNGWRYSDGLFLTQDGALVLKTKHDGIFYLSGDKVEDQNVKAYYCFVEGGTKGIVPCDIAEKICEQDKNVHPSYGMITVSRVNVSPPISLFGSSIKHGNMIRLEISHGKYERGINHDYYYKKGRICEVDLSMVQFAEIMTSIGNGDGIPCTIRFTERDGYMPHIEYVNKVEQYKSEFRNQLSDVEKSVDEAYSAMKELFDTKKTFNKADKEKILNLLNRAKMDIGCNAEYVLDSFGEQMEKTVKEARGEIEAFMQSKMNSIAMAAINDSINEDKMAIEDAVKIE